MRKFNPRKVSPKHKKKVTMDVCSLNVPTEFPENSVTLFSFSAFHPNASNLNENGRSPGFPEFAGLLTQFF